MKNPSFRMFGADLAPPATTCAIARCEAPPEPDAPLSLCLDHIRQAFGFYLRHAEDDHSARPEPQTADRSNGWVYFVRFGDLIKIGWTRTPEQRFTALQPDAVLHIRPGTRTDEQQLHAAFAHLADLERGMEYFRAEPDLINFINALHSGA